MPAARLCPTRRPEIICQVIIGSNVFIYVVDVSLLRRSVFTRFFCFPCCREIFTITYTQVTNVMKITPSFYVHLTVRYSYYFPVSQHSMTTWFCYRPMTCDHLHVICACTINYLRHCCNIRLRRAIFFHSPPFPISITKPL